MQKHNKPWYVGNAEYGMIHNAHKSSEGKVFIHGDKTGQSYISKC